MPWFYRIRKRIINNEPWFDVVEYVVMGKQKGWTRNSMTPGGETPDEVIKDLKRMLKDVKRTKYFLDKENHGKE